MAVLSDLLSRVRLELADLPKQFSKDFAGDGFTTRFALGYKPVDAATLQVTVNGSPVPTPSGYTVEVEFGVINFVHAPDLNAVINVSGSVWRFFTDEEITGFINTALIQHTYNRTDAYGSQITTASLPPIEEYPLVILSTVEALWALSTDASYDININAPDGVVIPRSQRFTQLMQSIDARMNQYKALCAALNIGLWRLEMGVLRRVSRTTNKLVPVYMAQEVDDGRRPERVYIQNDLLGRSPVPNYSQIYDLVLYQGDSFSCEFDFPFDITNLSFKAQIRTYPNAPSLYATFTVTVLSTSPTLSKIKLSLTKQNTSYMPVRAFWDLQATSTTDPNYEVTYVRGQVFTIQQVTLD